MAETQMRFLDHADLHARGIKYCKTQLWRLGRTGKFPRPVKLSSNRIAWLESDIDKWIEARVRDARPIEAA
jgi:prophage regulatory protein